MKKWPLIAVLSLILIFSAAFSANVGAQGPTVTPTPTPTPVTVDQSLQPGPDYYVWQAKVDDFFAGIVEWLDNAELKLADLDTIVADVIALASGATITVNGEAFSTETMIDEVETALSYALIFRCYADSPLVDALMLFFAVMLIVMLLRFIIGLMPYIQNLVDFVWGKLVDAWQSIPFI